MKLRNLIFTIAGFFLCNNAVAQCIADAGKDTTICSGLSGFGTIYLGGAPTAQNGVFPYTYTWTCDYWMGGGTLHFTASDFLDDTSLANPQIISGTISSPDYLTFYLTVTDSIGMVCLDSIKVRFSEYVYSLEYYNFYINEGDSVQFYGTPFVGGGIPPLIYTWSPSYGLSNANDLSTWASPDTNTYYSLTAIDSVGCISESFSYYYVDVTPVGIDENNMDKFNIYPNPASEYITINNLVSTINNNGELIVLNIMGETLQRYNVSKEINKININTTNIPNGIYLVVFNINGLLQWQNKIIINH